MNFTLSEDQYILRDVIARMVTESCDVRAVHEVIEQKAGFHSDLWNHLKDFGAAGLCIPEAYGGAGMELLEAALVTEILGYNGSPVPLISHFLATLALAHSDNEEAKQQWLPKLADGSLIGTVALGEGGEQWFPDQWQLELKDGAVTGNKEYIPAAMEADLFITGLKGGRLGVVAVDQPGVRREARDGVDRTRAIGSVVFDGAAVELIGEGDLGERLLEAALVLIAADSFGGASRLVDMSVSYAKEREQYGVKIGSFQALQHQLADMAMATEPSRGFYWYAAYAFDHQQDESARHASLAKAFIAENYMQVARDAVEAHGGIGFTWEYDVHIWFKRAMFNWAWCGSPAVHYERYATQSDW